MRRFLFVLLLMLPAQSAFAQNIPAARDTAAVVDSVRRLAPGKALMRSLLLPGWGQFSVGATGRGAFFLAAQGSSYYMLARTRSRLNDARDKHETQRELARDSILSVPEVDTTNLELKIDSLDAVIARKSLVNSRERQMQDWITYTIFFTLASGVDAFVAAHLADFPVQIETQPQTNGSMDVKFTVPLPSRRRR
jgi:hypothetical protein